MSLVGARLDLSHGFVPLAPKGLEARARRLQSKAQSGIGDREIAEFGDETLDFAPLRERFVGPLAEEVLFVLEAQAFEFFFDPGDGGAVSHRSIR